jgi:histone H2A
MVKDVKKIGKKSAKPTAKSAKPAAKAAKAAKSAKPAAKAAKAPKAPKAAKAKIEKVSTRPTKSSKAGIVVPVSRVNRKLINSRIADRISAATPIYLAAIVEYILGEIISLSGDTIRANGKMKRIKPSDVLLSIRTDEDLGRLFAGHKVLSGDHIRTNVSEFTTDTDKKYAEFKAVKQTLEEA